MKCDKCGKESSNHRGVRGKKHLSCGGRKKGKGLPRKDLGRWQ